MLDLPLLLRFLPYEMTNASGCAEADEPLGGGTARADHAYTLQSRARAPNCFESSIRDRRTDFARKVELEPRKKGATRREGQ